MFTANRSLKLLSPQLLHGLRNLSLAARQAAEGFLNGAHASRRHGAGMEFSQYRPYQPGDDLRRLDWRLAARSDRYYLRESEIDTSLTVHLLLDASASMNHRDDNGLTKLDYARLLLAALAYLATQQGDAVGLTILSPAGLQHLAPRADARQLPRLYHALEKTKAAGHFPSAGTLAPLTARRQRALTVCVSDLYEESTEINALLTRLRATSGDVLLLHLMAHNELKFSYQAQLLSESWKLVKPCRLMPTSNARPTTSSCKTGCATPPKRPAARASTIISSVLPNRWTGPSASFCGGAIP